jgi:putative colanic acid biosynthesis acetyltransferase WcaF
LGETTWQNVLKILANRPSHASVQTMPGVDLTRYDQSWYSRGASGVICTLWEIIDRALVRPSPRPLFGWRRLWYRIFGAQLGAGVRICPEVHCKYPWKLTIGDHAWIGEGADLYSLERIEIGAHAVVSQRAVLCTGSHDHTDPAFGLIVKPIRIGSSAWVAIEALVMPGVTVGEGALVGARAVLLRDAEPWTIYHGQPATAKGRRELQVSTP